jgi:hypothetical protein
MEKHMVLFQFEGMELREACWIDGKPYFTRRAIGEWLQYADPQKAIDNIVWRNPHIEDPRWSVPLKLRATDGKEYETQGYDPIGFQLIVFESRQAKALAYKIAVANLAWAYMNGELVPSRWARRGDLAAAARQIHSLPPSRARGRLVRDLAEHDGVSRQTAYRRLQLVSGKRLREKSRSDRGRTKYPEEKARVFEYSVGHPKAGGKQIRETLGLVASVARINAWKREQRARG